MNLNGAIDETEIPVKGDEVYVHNTWTDSIPTVIQGFGSGKVGHVFAVGFHSRVVFVEELGLRQ